MNGRSIKSPGRTGGRDFNNRGPISLNDPSDRDLQLLKPLVGLTNPPRPLRGVRHRALHDLRTCHQLLALQRLVYAKVAYAQPCQEASFRAVTIYHPSAALGQYVTVNSIYKTTGVGRSYDHHL